MMYNVFILLGLLGLLLIVASFIPRINAWMRSITSVFAMLIFSVLAISAYDVNKMYVDYRSTTGTRVLEFKGYDAIVMSDLCWLMFIIAFIMLIVNSLYTYVEMDFKSLKNIGKREPSWKKRKRERQNNTGVER